MFQSRILLPVSALLVGLLLGSVGGIAGAEYSTPSADKAVDSPPASLAQLGFPYHAGPFATRELAMKWVKKNRLNRYRIRFGTERGAGYYVDYRNNS